MTNLPTIITSPAVDKITAEVEFYIADGKVRLVIIKTHDMLSPTTAAAIGDSIKVPEYEVG